MTYRETQFDEDAVTTPDFLADLELTLGPRMKKFDDVAGEVYAALCNVEWLHRNGARFATTWRMSGQYVADIRGKGEDYLDWYCNGNEGRVSEIVAKAMGELGWEGKSL